MDTVRNGILFRNGSAITATYEPYPEYHHLDIRDRYIEFRRDERPAVRGHRANNLIYDDFADFDQIDDFSEPLIDLMNSVQPGYTISPDEVQDRFNKWWYEVGQYEFSIDGDKIAIRQKEAPDFGELSPSQELNDFVNTLVQGE